MPEIVEVMAPIPPVTVMIQEDFPVILKEPVMLGDEGVGEHYCNFR